MTRRLLGLIKVLTAALIVDFAPPPYRAAMIIAAINQSSGQTLQMAINRLVSNLVMQGKLDESKALMVFEQGAARAPRAPTRTPDPGPRTPDPVGPLSSPPPPYMLLSRAEPEHPRCFVSLSPR